MPAIASRPPGLHCIGRPDQPQRPHAIKWWEVGAVVGAGVLTMALVDAPVQEWTANPDHGSSTGERHRQRRASTSGSRRWWSRSPAGIILVGLDREEAGRLPRRPPRRRVRGRRQRGDAGLQVLPRPRAALRHERRVGLPARSAATPRCGRATRRLAFAFATALSQEIHRTWATVGLYTLATGDRRGRACTTTSTGSVMW